jgi:hypothetical protein
MISQGKFCQVRKDLQAQDLKVPVSINGNVFYRIGGNTLYTYRWSYRKHSVGAQFQINGGFGWVEADSIDFDFTN